MARPVARRSAPVPIFEAEADLGDTALVVREFSDGMFTIDLPQPKSGPLVVGIEAMQQIVGVFDRLGKAKGWL